MEDFNALLVASDDGQPVVVVSGEVDVATAPTFRQVVLERVAATLVTVDLAKVTFIDIAGLRALEELAVQARVVDGSLRLRDPSGPVRFLLEFRKRFDQSEPWVMEEPQGV